MNASLEKLISLASAPLSEDTPRLIGQVHELTGAIGTQLLELLWARNGFYAFESALHVLPATNSPKVIGLARWNSAESWRSDYGEMAHGCLFFGEDLVGGQFCVFNDAAYKFDPETGEKTLLGETIGQWADVILRDHRGQTLWPLGHEWQAKHGNLPPGKRLAPKTPFVLGGEYSIDNLYVADAEELMRFYANVAVQLHDLPEGARVTLRTVD